MIRPLTFLGFGVLALAARAADLVQLLDERLACVVAVEFTIVTETERHPSTVLGTVVDSAGTVILPPSAVPPTIAPDQLVDFKAFHAGEGEGTAATYLGQDAYTGWHFVRVGEELRARLKPVTAFATGPVPVGPGTELWGIGLRGHDEDFAPYLLQTRAALVAHLPNATAVTAQDVAGPGLPVFDPAGRFAGLAQNSFGQNFLIFTHGQNGTPAVLVNVEESSVVLLADEVLPNVGRVPHNVAGRPSPWIGVYGVAPVDPDVARLIQLGRETGVVLSDIQEGSPAAVAGLQDRDIVVAIDGKPLPRLKPDRVVATYFNQELLRRRPGDTVTLGIRRGTERRDVAVTLGDEPKMVREASRRYFERLGFTAREFLALDAIVNRAPPGEHGGVVVNFVRPAGAAATAGLRPDDWIREIDGAPVADFAAAVEKLGAIENARTTGELVLLVSRGGETQVLHVKLN